MCCLFMCVVILRDRPTSMTNPVAPSRISVDFVCRQGVIFFYKSYIRLNFEVSRQIADYCFLQLIVLVRVFVHFVLRLFVGQSRLSSLV